MRLSGDPNRREVQCIGQGSRERNANHDSQHGHRRLVGGECQLSMWANGACGQRRQNGGARRSAGSQVDIAEATARYGPASMPAQEEQLIEREADEQRGDRYAKATGNLVNRRRPGRGQGPSAQTRFSGYDGSGQRRDKRRGNDLLVVHGPSKFTGPDCVPDAG